jgi:N-acetyl-anhydromuramyl-L-alanine amidase AmpD
MIVNKEFLVGESLYTKKTEDKHRIIINDTSRLELIHHLSSFDLLKKIPHYTIDRDGIIYEHYNINYYSDYYKDYPELNKSSIIISMVNAGNLVYKHDAGFMNWANDMIDGKDVHEFVWKSYRYWHTYSTKQLIALRSLIKHITDLIPDINPNNIFGSSIYDERAQYYHGVISESNIFRSSYSVNPNFDWPFISLTE